MRYLVVIIAIVAAVGTFLTLHRRQVATVAPIVSSSPTSTSTAVPTVVPVVSPSPTTTPLYAEPIAEFRQRNTKKHFGDYITPATSPVQPERFTGYHTGSDVEYTDTTADVPVFAITDCTVQEAQWVSGYGGLLVLKCPINGQEMFVLYGHVRVSSLPAVGAAVMRGQQVGVLGTGNSTETDCERHHLHFAIAKTLDVRGYVQNKSELSNWIDPLTVLP